MFIGKKVAKVAVVGHTSTMSETHRVSPKYMWLKSLHGKTGERGRFLLE